MPDAALYPIADRLAEDLRTARYGLFEAGVSAALESFDGLAPLAAALLERRGRRRVRVEDARVLVWGERPDETRPAVSVTFETEGGEAEVLTCVLHAERAGHLFAAIRAAAEARKAARTRAA